MQNNASANDRIEPSIRVEVRCRREDLLIEDLELKDETLMDKLSFLTGFKNRLAAAEAYIRDELLRQGLYFGEINDPYGILCLADVVADVEGSID